MEQHHPAYCPLILPTLAQQVTQVIGANWFISPLTELSSFIELQGVVYCELYLYKLDNGIIADRAYHRFVLYKQPIVNFTFEEQCMRVLMEMKNIQEQGNTKLAYVYTD